MPCGLPVYSTGIRDFIRQSFDVHVGRTQLQMLHQRLGLVCGGVRGVDSAKEARRVRVSRFEFCKHSLEADELPLAERELRVYSDESYVHANHAGKTTWGLSEKAWQDAVHQDAVEKIAAGQDLSKTHIDMAGLADGGAKTPLVRQACITSRRQMTVIVDMISEHGRVHRTRAG